MNVLDYHERKKKFMDARFGKMKSFVLRRRQLTSMRKKIDDFVNDNIHSNNILQQVLNMCNVFDYMYSVRDIWQGSEQVKAVVKKKLTDFGTSHPLFNKYMISFGFACPYVKRNKEICYRPFVLCNTHKLCLDRLFARIDDCLFFLPGDICKIIIQYATPYSRKL